MTLPAWTGDLFAAIDAGDGDAIARYLIDVDISRLHA